jgi:hypothetical protein
VKNKNNNRNRFSNKAILKTKVETKKNISAQIGRVGEDEKAFFSGN